ncbi:MAG: nicotinate-nicotinamide nucleotide adenylyltransferase [Gaiellaceae bacterium]
MTGLLGGAFDPPHNGHLALARAAVAHFDLERLVVLVAARPGHRAVAAPGPVRLRLAEAAFADVPGALVELDEHAHTVDLLRENRFDDPIFLLGADQWAAFRSWKEPEEVLAQARLGVAARPGSAELAADEHDRVTVFPIEPVPVSSSQIRALVAAGEPISGLVPAAVERLIAELGLYRAG